MKRIKTSLASAATVLLLTGAAYAAPIGEGLVFLVSIIFYLFVDEPQRRATFFARFGMQRSPPEIGRGKPAEKIR